MLFKHFLKKKDLINNMLDTEILVIKSKCRNENKRKIVNIVKLKIPRDKITGKASELQKKAVKQKEVLDYFISNNIKEIELTVLLKELNISSTTVKSLVQKNIIEIIKKEIDRDPFNNKDFRDKKVILSTQQVDVLNRIIESAITNNLKTILLHGVTGSG